MNYWSSLVNHQINPQSRKPSLYMHHLRAI